eukprot:429789_1
MLNSLGEVQLKFSIKAIMSRISSIYKKTALTAMIGLGGSSGVYIWWWSNNQVSVEDRLIKIKNSFENYQPLESKAIGNGICARIKCMKPNKPNSFYHFTTKNKPYSWCFGDDGIYDLSQCENDHEKLIVLGLNEEAIKIRLKKNYYWNLYLFPQQGENYECFEGTWDGIFELLEQNEPEIFERIKSFQSDLKTKTFDEIESMSDLKFWQMKRASKMTKERFLEINKEDITLIDTRFLFYCYLDLNEYFAGNGYTVDCNGKIGCKEYIIKNMELTNVEKIKQIKLTVQPSN